MGGWALAMICNAHLHGGAIDDAQRYADELVRIGRRRNDEEAVAQALTVCAGVQLARGNLADARSLFADAAALAPQPGRAPSRFVVSRA